MSAVVAIPARMKSIRFPGKVLADINGRPMLWHVYKGASQAKLIDDVWIITDNQNVYDQACSWGAKALMTAEHWPSGTARIASVAEKLETDIVVNVQGDEPLITGQVVKVVLSSKHEAMYFSRSSIPLVRDVELTEWAVATQYWGHCGVYAYRKAVLLDYLLLPEGILEKAEKLEQLRLLESGKRFLAVEIDYHPEAVDTPSDLERVQRILNQQTS